MEKDLHRELEWVAVAHFDIEHPHVRVALRGLGVGKYDSRMSYGQDGVQVVWYRIIFPDASSIDINGMVRLDAHSNSGVRHEVDHHYKRLFGFAALTSAFSAAFDFSQRNTQSALTYPSVGIRQMRLSGGK